MKKPLDLSEWGCPQRMVFPKHPTKWSWWCLNNPPLQRDCTCLPIGLIWRSKLGHQRFFRLQTHKYIDSVSELEYTRIYEDILTYTYWIYLSSYIYLLNILESSQQTWRDGRWRHWWSAIWTSAPSLVHGAKALNLSVTKSQNAAQMNLFSQQHLLTILINNC